MPKIRTQRLIWIAAFAAIVVLAAGWYHSAAERDRESRQTAQRLAALEQEQQQASVDAMPSDTFDPAERAAYAARAQGRINASKARARAGMVSEAELKRNQAKVRAELESRFAADGSDPRWAQGVETAATTAIKKPVLAPFTAPADSDMRCARTMCRMEFIFASEGEADDWAAYYPLGVGAELPVIQSQTTRLPDGRVQLVLYGYRSKQAQPVR